MEDTLTQEQHKKLSDPCKLIKDGVHDDLLKQFIVLRHYVAKYELQVHAYGPFRTAKKNAELEVNVELDDARRDRDFPPENHKGFQKFLKEIRFHLWLMEDEFIEKRALSNCCEKELWINRQAQEFLVTPI